MIPLLGLALVVAVLDWWAVRNDALAIEAGAKPLVMVVLVAAVMASGPSTAGVLIALGLCCSLFGDILLLPSLDRFIFGLGAFFVGHVCFVAGFVAGTESFSTVGLVIGLLVGIAVTMTIGQRIRTGARSHDPRLHVPVAAYIGVLALMLVAGQATGSAIAALGAVPFAGSDAVLGWNRFVHPIRDGRFWTHVPYHLGQGLIALWAIGL